MRTASAIARTKTGNSLKPAAESLSDGAFDPLLCFTNDYTVQRGLLQQVINVPLGLLIFAHVAVQSGLKAAQSRSDIDIKAPREMDRTEAAHDDTLFF